MDQDALLELAQKHLIRYASAFAPFVVSRAEGSWIWDQDGNKYLDFTGGQICLSQPRPHRQQGGGSGPTGATSCGVATGTSQAIGTV
jgi:hypothetical protein